MIPIPIGPFHVISLEPRWDIPLLTPTTGSGQLREFGVVVVYGGEYYFLTNQPHFDMLWIFVGSGWSVATTGLWILLDRKIDGPNGFYCSAYEY